MELAERLGMTEASLRREMSGRELQRWMVLDKLRIAEAEKEQRRQERMRRGRR